jgi:hypothetical protein
MTLSKLTPSQEAILYLIYRYRFLSRIQIQKFMGHKDYKRINVWLRDMRENGYVEWIYSTDFLEKSKPGIYYLGPNGIRSFRKMYIYPATQLRKRYRESSRSAAFIEQCMLLADCCFVLESKNRPEVGRKHVYYSCVLKSDYQHSGSELYFLSESDLIEPPLVFVNTYADEGDITGTTRFVEIIEPTMPRYSVRRRLKNYLEYLGDGYWQSATIKEEPNPIVMVVCPNLVELIYCKRATKRLLEENWGDDIALWFTTADKLKAHGITGDIWEIVHAPEYD